MYVCRSIEPKEYISRIPNLASAQDHDQFVYFLMYLSLDQLGSGPEQSSKYRPGVWGLLDTGSGLQSLLFKWSIDCYQACQFPIATY